MTDSTYDVFISYAREDARWVHENLHARLVLCRTRDGRRPKVFMDTSVEGIAAGANFVTALNDALQSSGWFLPVYTRTYFVKPMCEWELKTAFRLDPNGRLGKIVPILVESEAASLVPLYIGDRNYLDIHTEDWFGRLCTTLGLMPQQAPPRLEFRQCPHEARVNETLPLVKVAIVATEQGWLRDEDVTLAAEHGGLQGTLTVKSAEGVATFSDLFLTTTQSPTRLVAFAEGAVAAYSEPFPVLEDRTPRETVPAPRPSDAVLPCHGEVYFFDRDETLAIVTRTSIRVFDRRGASLGEATLSSPPRLVRRYASGLAIAEWSGDVRLCLSDGRIHHWPVERGSEGIDIIGDLHAQGEVLLVGHWNGRIVRLESNQKPVTIVRHEGGVQGLVESGGVMFVCDLEGALCLYQGTRLVQSFPAEPVIRLVQVFPKCLVVVGETRLYNLPFDQRAILGENLRIGKVVAALGDIACPVLVDAQGKGVTIDDELAVRSSFHAAAGAVPMSADRQSRRCVFLNRDGSRGLMVDGRLTYSYSGGVLAVSPSSECFALGDGERIQLFGSAEFAALTNETRNVDAAH